MHARTPGRGWQPTGSVRSMDLATARRMAHNAAQWPARLAHSYLPHEAGNAHLDLAWDEAAGVLVGRDIGGGLAVELDIANLALQFREDGRPTPHRLDMDGRSPAMVEAWILIELLHRHRDRDRFSKMLPFEISGLMTGDTSDFLQEANAGEFAELERWYANAATVLREVAGPATPIVCAPEHLDLAVVLPLADRPTGGVRAGFAPGDERLGEPFFYVALGRHLETPERAGVARIGRVQTRDLVAAALPASELATKPDPAAAARAFLEAAIADARKRQAH